MAFRSAGEAVGAVARGERESQIYRRKWRVQRRGAAIRQVASQLHINKPLYHGLFGPTLARHI